MCCHVGVSIQYCVSTAMVVCWDVYHMVLMYAVLSTHADHL